MVHVLITGSDGQLGMEFRALAPGFPNHHFHFTDIADLDITDEARTRMFIAEHEPDVIINCAGYTAVDLAEDEPELAMKLNYGAVASLAKACDEHGIYLVHISTDYVFDGKKTEPYREDDIPSPLSVYGISKLEGEEAMMACLQEGLIIRTSWLYSSFGRNFVKTILGKCASKDSLNVVNDQHGSPTYARDLAGAILGILPAAMASKKLELLHYANEGSCTWFEFAREIAHLAGLPCQISPVGTKDYPFKAPRPAYSVLDKSLIREKFGIIIPDWKISLKKCVESIIPPIH